MRPNPVRTNLPMVETAAQAQQIASWCRSQGVRGVAFGTPRNDYAGGDVGQKLPEANERALVIALIETAAGIAGTKASRGIDIGWLGDFRSAGRL